MLAKLASKEEEADKSIYENLWNEFGQVIKEGFVEDPKNIENLTKLLRFSSSKTQSDQQIRSVQNYVDDIKKDQDKIYYLLADSYQAAKSNPHLEQLQKQGIEVLFFTDRIDPWMAEHLKEFDGKEFQDVGRGNFSLPKADEKDQDAVNKRHKSFIAKLEENLKDRVEKINVSQRLVESAACVVPGDNDLPPQMKRMLEASDKASRNKTNS